MSLFHLHVSLFYRTQSSKCCLCSQILLAYSCADKHSRGEFKTVTAVSCPEDSTSKHSSPSSASMFFSGIFYFYCDPAFSLYCDFFLCVHMRRCVCVCVCGCVRVRASAWVQRVDTFLYQCPPCSLRQCLLMNWSSHFLARLATGKLQPSYVWPP